MRSMGASQRPVTQSGGHPVPLCTLHAQARLADGSEARRVHVGELRDTRDRLCAAQAEVLALKDALARASSQVRGPAAQPCRACAASALALGLWL